MKFEIAKKIKWGFVVNPKAGEGKALKLIKKITDTARKFNRNIEIKYTTKKGEASDIALDFADNGFTHIISVGGDGTHNECIQKITEKNIIFGVISAGSGNDFPPVLGFPERFKNEDFEELFKSETIKTDIGICNGRYFLNAIGAGYDAAVAHDMEKLSQKGKRDKLHYYTSVLKNLFSLKPIKLSLTSKTKTLSLKIILSSIAIGRHIGGGFHITPTAIANDGHFDVCVVKYLNAVKRSLLLIDVFGKKHKENKNVEYFQSDNINLEFDNDIPCHIDGEVFFERSVNVKLLKNKMEFIYNPLRSHYLEIKELIIN